MIKRALMRLLPAAPVLATGWLVRAPWEGVLPVRVAGAQEQPGPGPQPGSEPSPCQLRTRLELSPKLVCPLESITLTLHIQPVCPREPDGRRAQISELEIIHPLGKGLRHAVGSVAGQEQAGGGMIIGRVPDQGLTWHQGLVAMSPGTYEIGRNLRFRLNDSAGRKVELPLSQSLDLVVIPCSYDGMRTVFLPLVQRPRCQSAIAPADIVLAIDSSGSMGEQGVALTMDQARTFINSLNLQRDRVALVAFDRAPRVLTGLTENRGLIMEALKAVRPGNGTAIDRAIQQGVELLEDPNRPAGRRRVLALVTDGYQAASTDENDIRAAASRAHRAGIRIITIAVGSAEVGPNRALLQEISESAARTITVFNGSDQTALSQAFRDLADLAGCGD